jgi:polyhydroxyalkanoate synthesis regulator phasin
MSKDSIYILDEYGNKRYRPNIAYELIFKKYDFPNNYNPKRNKIYSSYPGREVTDELKTYYHEGVVDMCLFEHYMTHESAYENAENAYDALYSEYEMSKAKYESQIEQMREAPKLVHEICTKKYESQIQQMHEEHTAIVKMNRDKLHETEEALHRAIHEIENLKKMEQTSQTGKKSPVLAKSKSQKAPASSRKKKEKKAK